MSIETKILTHVGTQKIETERLLLRRFEVADAEEMFKNWASDTENCEYMTWSAHKSIEDTKEFISSVISNYKNKNCYKWMIVLKETNELIGNISADGIDECARRAHLGYIISKKYWGKGFMTEALKSVINYLFEKVNFARIQAWHDIKNPASGRVMEKCGMKYEGTLRKYCKNNLGELVDTPFYAIIREEWGN